MKHVLLLATALVAAPALHARDAVAALFSPNRIVKTNLARYANLAVNVNYEQKLGGKTSAGLLAGYKLPTVIHVEAVGTIDGEKQTYTGDIEPQGLFLNPYKEFLNQKAGAFTDLASRPGRFETSLEEASMDAWIKYYRQDENSVNNQISYYDKGEIVNMMLDLSIRTASNGAKSLDDVMPHLYNEFYKRGRNYTPEDFQKVSETMAGKSLDEFFSKYVRGESEIDYDGILAGVGLSVSSSQAGKNRAYIGADTAEENGRLTVRSVPAGKPAYDQGINTDHLFRLS